MWILLTQIIKKNENPEASWALLAVNYLEKGTMWKKNECARHSAWDRFLKCFETGMLKWQNKDKRNSFHPYREQLEQNKKVMFDSLNEAFLCQFITPEFRSRNLYRYEKVFFRVNIYLDGKKVTINGELKNFLAWLNSLKIERKTKSLRFVLFTLIIFYHFICKSDITIQSW